MSSGPARTSNGELKYHVRGGRRYPKGSGKFPSSPQAKRAMMQVYGGAGLGIPLGIGLYATVYFILWVFSWLQYEFFGLHYERAIIFIIPLTVVITGYVLGLQVELPPDLSEEEQRALYGGELADGSR